MLKTVNAALEAQSRAIGIEVNTKAKTIKFGLQVSRSASLKMVPVRVVASDLELSEEGWQKGGNADVHRFRP